MSVSEKILSIEQVAERANKLRGEGKKIVLCHGVFDLLHIGHLRYFQEAKTMGDVLIVTLTTDQHVNKGPNRPAFTESLRAEMIAGMACVDFVAVSRWPTAVEAIGQIKPDLYVKGPDYKNAANDLTQKLGSEEEAVIKHGGRLAFTNDVLFSASTLINRYMPTMPAQTQSFLNDFSTRHSIDQVLGYLRNAEGLKVLVIGETIIDEYVYCTAIGKSSKEPTLVVKHLSAEKFAGGILAAANHMSGFCREVGMITMLGDQNSHIDYIESSLKPNIKRMFVHRQNAPTIVKRRLVEQYFFTKMLEVYEINDAPIEQEEDDAVCALLEEQIPQYDLVLVIDFGHGMLSERAIKIINTRAKFLAVNAQTNAGNLGLNPLSRYNAPDLLSATDLEVRLEARRRTGDIGEIAKKVRDKLKAKRMVVTRGKNGSLCLEQNEQPVLVPAVGGLVVDRIGAGDAFLSIATLVAYQNAPMEVVGLIGNAAGAIAVATVGNREPVDKIALMKHLTTLLK